MTSKADKAAAAEEQDRVDAAELAKSENESATTATDERLYHKKAQAWVNVTKAYDDDTKDVQEEGENGRFWAHVGPDELDTKGPE